MKEYAILPEGNFKRRWFKDDHIDVIVWVSHEGLYGFQITYDWKAETNLSPVLEQHVVSYFEKSGLKHQYVRPENNQFPTPKILFPHEAEIPVRWLCSHLSANLGDMPVHLAALILQRLNLAMARALSA
jgi:hypothetical protein